MTDLSYVAFGIAAGLVILVAFPRLLRVAFRAIIWRGSFLAAPKRAWKFETWEPLSPKRRTPGPPCPGCGFPMERLASSFRNRRRGVWTWGCFDAGNAETGEDGCDVLTLTTFGPWLPHVDVEVRLRR